MSMVRTRRLTYGISPMLDREYNHVQYGTRAFGGVIYRCPSGRRAILRDLIIAATTGGPSGSTLLWITPWSGPSILISAPATPSAYTGWHGVIDAVMEEMDELTLATDLGDLSWYISGAELVI